MYPKRKCHEMKLQVGVHIRSGPFQVQGESPPGVQCHGEVSVFSSLCVQFPLHWVENDWHKQVWQQGDRLVKWSR